MIYTYNEKLQSFGIYTNFEPKNLTKDDKIISEKKFNELKSKNDEKDGNK